MNSTVAFIGLGHMGGPMAARLAGAGHRVLGFDLVPDLLAAAAATGVEPAGSAAEAAAAADVVITMLPAGRHVLGLYGEGGSSPPPGRAPCSSTAPPSTWPTPERRTRRPSPPGTGRWTLRSPAG